MMNPGSGVFLKYGDLIAPLPFPAVIALLLLLGTVFLGKRLARGLCRSVVNNQDLAAGFISASALLGGVLHAMALAHLIPLLALRLVGSFLMFFGLLEIRQLWQARKTHYHAARRLAQGLYRESPLAVIVVAAISVGVFLAVWAPASDVDSLDYHLGVPLDWIRHGGAFPRSDWFHARLIGLGEMINLLGLAMGTDCLGAAFQASGLVVAIVAISALARTPKDLLFAGSMVLACPSIVFLTFSQKPQLLPCAATTLALAMTLKHFRGLDPVRSLFILSCLSFALGCKYSFIFSVAVLLPVVFAAACKSGRAIVSGILPMVMLFLLAGPVYARNFFYYGDPISPMLEKWKAGSDPAVRNFASYLRDFGGERSASRLFRLPWHLLATRHPGKLTTVLGVGVLAFLLVRWRQIEPRTALIAAFSASFLIVALGQLTARFFFEPYLWCAAAAVGTDWRLPKRMMLGFLTFQGILVAGMVAYAALTYLPAALTSQWRDSFLAETCEDYAATKWMNDTLPEESVMIAETRAATLLPRPFVSIDLARFRPRPDKINGAGDLQLARELKDRGVTAVVFIAPLQDSVFRTISPYLMPSTASVRVQSTAHNPLMRGPAYEFRVCGLDRDKIVSALERSQK